MNQTPETNEAAEPERIAEPDTVAAAAAIDPHEKRMPEDWEEEYGLLVRDPDGWREPNAPAWTDPITLLEFATRYARSTVHAVTNEKYERFEADVRAARRAAEAAENPTADDRTGQAAPADAAPQPAKETNAQKLKRAATALRMRGWAGDDFAADMLERCEPIANHWSEPYAAVFVPLLESALRLARVVLDDEPDQKPLLAPGGKKLIRMAVTGELMGQILHLPEEIRVHGVDYYAQLDRLDFLVHNPDAPAEAIRMSPVFERSSAWPDPIHLCDIRYAYPGGITPPAEPARPRLANLAEAEV